MSKLLYLHQTFTECVSSQYAYFVAFCVFRYFRLKKIYRFFFHFRLVTVHMYLKMYRRTFKIFEKLTKRDLLQIVAEIMEEVVDYVNKNLPGFIILWMGDFNFDNTTTQKTTSGCNVKSNNPDERGLMKFVTQKLGFRVHSCLERDLQDCQRSIDYALTYNTNNRVSNLFIPYFIKDYLNVARFLIFVNQCLGWMETLPYV